MEEKGPPSQPNESITRESVLKAERQTEAACVKLMNDMKASVWENGEFFIELGQPGETNLRIDTRALIPKVGRPMNSTGGGTNLPNGPEVDTSSKLDSELNAVASNEKTGDTEIPRFLRRGTTETRPEDENQYIVITAKGIKIATLDPESVRNSPFHPPGRNNGINNSDGGNSIRWGEMIIALSEITTDADEQFVNEAMTESIKASRKTSENAKNELALEKAKEGQVRAQRLSGILDKAIQPPAGEDQATLPPASGRVGFPPPPAGEGPAIPPPPQSPTGRFGS